MDLLEYQAKQLFTTVEIPVLPSQSILKPGDLKKLQIPYPIVLKSQVKAASRGKAGGVKFVENTIDAIAAAQTIFQLPIEGEYPEVILAESRYDVADEFFLAIMFDYQLKKPVLLGSSHGGIDIESLFENMKICVIDDIFSPFYARNLAIQMGLEGNLIKSVSSVIEKMYSLFWKKDLEIIEINPLGINSNGEVMALDGKIRVNDYALLRHPDLLKLLKNSLNCQLNQPLHNSFITSENSAFTSFFPINEKGKIAIISDSLDLTLVTCDLILEKKGIIGACFLLDKQEYLPLQKQLLLICDRIFDTSNLQFILVNVLANDNFNLGIVEAIADFYKNELDDKANKGEERMERLTGSKSRTRVTRRSKSTIKKVQRTKQIQWILRIVGDNQNIDEIINEFTDLPIKVISNLEEAITLTIDS